MARLYITGDCAVEKWPNADHGVIQEVNDKELKKISLLTSPSGSLALFEIPNNDISGVKELTNLIYLDGIQDPGNAGTIIRIADWYGVDGIIRSTDSADFFAPKVVQASMGSIGQVPLWTIDHAHFSNAFSSFKKVGASIEPMARYTPEANNRICLVVGNEGKGISPEIMEELDATIFIPGSHNKAAESLNVSVATGIICQHIFGESL